MKQIYLFAFMLTLSFSMSAQNYGFSTSTGTEEPYEYNAPGSTVLGVTSNDVLSTWQSIPFSFNFYGQAVTGYYASDNGYITFSNTPTASEPVNTAIPSVGGPNNAIYAFWDDLGVVSGSGSVDEVVSFDYGAAPNRVHVIQWYSVTPASGSGFLYTAIRLYECGDFDIIHNYGNATGLTATVGCENAAGTSATQIAGSPNIDYPATGSLATDDVVHTFYWDQISYDMSVTSSDLSGFVMIGANTVSGTIANLGSSNITSFDLNYSVDGGATQTMAVNAFVNSMGGMYTFTHNIPWDVTVGGLNHDLCIWASNINGGNADSRTCNDELCTPLFSGTGASGTRTVLIETFTGSWSGWSPDGDVVLESIVSNYPNDVVPVVIHDGDGMEFSDGIRSGFNVSAYPNGMVDRKVFVGEADEPHSRGQWEANTVSQIGSYTPADVSMVHLYDPITRDITITVKGNFVDYASGDLRFVAMIVEDNVTGSGAGYDQVNYLDAQAGHPYEGAGDPIVGYVHRHVLRALPGGAFGNAGVIPSPSSPGDFISETFTYNLPVTMDEMNIKLIGFMAYYSTTVGEREVIDVAQMDLAYLGNASTETLEGVVDFQIYPNPASSILNVEFELPEAQIMRVAIYDAFGQLIDVIGEDVFSVGTQQLSHDVSNLESGVYFISITTETNQTTTKRFTVIK